MSSHRALAHYTSEPSHIKQTRALLPLYGSVATAGLSMGAATSATAALVWAHLSAGGSPVEAGVLAAALSAPIAAGLFFGGGVVDRFGPRRVLLWTDVLSALAALAAVAILLAAPEALGAVVAAVALANLLGAPGGVAQDARVPELARLAGMATPRANALRDVAAQLGQVGGPAAGVLLVEWGGLPAALGAAAAALVAIAAIDLALFPCFRARPLPAGPRLGGLATVLADPGLRVVALAGVLLVGVFGSLDELVAPALALEFGESGEALARFLALAGGGALLGAGAFAAAAPRLDGRAAFLGCLATAAAGLAILAAAAPAVGFVAAPILIGLGVGPLWPLALTAVQSRVPTATRGAALGALVGVAVAAQPVAALLGGPAIALLGAQGTATALAALVGALALAAPFAPSLRILSTSEA